jgi:uncharacterized protein (UPF0332 family)
MMSLFLSKCAFFQKNIAIVALSILLCMSTLLFGMDESDDSSDEIKKFLRRNLSVNDTVKYAETLEGENNNNQCKILENLHAYSDKIDEILPEKGKNKSPYDALSSFFKKIWKTEEKDVIIDQKEVKHTSNDIFEIFLSVAEKLEKLQPTAQSMFLTYLHYHIFNHKIDALQVFLGLEKKLNNLSQNAHIKFVNILFEIADDGHEGTKHMINTLFEKCNDIPEICLITMMENIYQRVRGASTLFRLTEEHQKLRIFYEEYQKQEKLIIQEEEKNTFPKNKKIDQKKENCILN